MVNHGTQNTGQAPYYISLAAFLASLGLLLLTIVDIRRGFLFSNYFKVGAPSTLLNLDPRQLGLLLIGIIGAWLSYRAMKRLESTLKESINFKRLATILAIAIGVLLVTDLFIYRGVPTSRFLAAGKMSIGSGPMGLGRAIPVTSLPDWLQPAGDGINYLLVVWHATTLGMFLGSLFLVAGAGLVMKLHGNSFITHLTGSAVSLTQPFCSCCAAPIGSALYRKGASLGPTLAFTVSAPMLNITSLILASALLPTQFALLRIAGGIIVGVFITYGVSRLAARWLPSEETEAGNNKLVGWASKALSAYSRLFNFEKLFSEAATDSPSALISNWLGMTWRLARVMVPILLVGSVLAVYIVLLMPQTSNSLAGVVTTAVFGTLLMVPTWTEIPLAAGLVNSGLTGIAAAALITLPAVSIPCLSVLAGAMNNLKVALTLGLSVLAAGILAGIIFL
ncbi:MAG: permease [Chloroflexi bacterium]|nr:permease [Chloroflexota bacterium]